MATILSLKTISAIPGASMHLDTATSTDITLFLKDGRVIIFKQFKNGLYVYDANADLHKTKPLIQHYSLLQTITNNKSYFT